MVQILYSATIEYTDLHFKLNNKAPLDRVQWAALHIGFTACMKVMGYQSGGARYRRPMCRPHGEELPEYIKIGGSIKTW